ncbi:hypothetical protein BKA69DRAFT_1042726 [Paraphysoderma sedebokerense]|nr:hypothetical protein BKA69DRAFT_1042726 [Paraphysoderma sedebokerense]
MNFTKLLLVVALMLAVVGSLTAAPVIGALGAQVTKVLGQETAEKVFTKVLGQKMAGRLSEKVLGHTSAKAALWASGDVAKKQISKKVIAAGVIGTGAAGTLLVKNSKGQANDRMTDPGQDGSQTFDESQ